MGGVESISFFVAFLAIALLVWAWKVIYWVWLKPRKLEKCLRGQGLAGNPYRTYFGDLKDTSKLLAEERETPIPFTNDYFRRILPLQHKLLNQYGEHCFNWRGPVPVINVIDPELIKDAFYRIYDFQKPILNPFFRLFVQGLTTYEGATWAKHRKLMKPCFRMEKIKHMLPAFRTSVNQMMNQWEQIVSGSGKVEIDMWPCLQTLTGDVISRAAFSSDFEEGRRIFEILNEQREIVARSLLMTYPPGWKYFPSKSKKRMQQTNGEIQKILKGIIDKRKRATRHGEPSAKDDLLGILMESNFEELVNECKEFYLAGQEATSSMLVWTIILLSKHQDWQTQAREEIFATFGKNQPDFDGLNNLKTVTMILYEVLRLYPPMPFATRRISNRETKLGNLSLPDGAMVALHILHAHQDPNIWGHDAKEFNPERFSEGVGRATRGNISFFPFIYGPRICIGKSFALVEAKVVLSMILQRFAFEISPSYAHAPVVLVTLQPQHGAHVILHRLRCD